MADSASPSSYTSDNPDDYVQVRDGEFVLAGKPFVIKGTNYFGDRSALAHRKSRAMTLMLLNGEPLISFVLTTA
jgi:hypothetical protein